tara:strand:- start:3843 stop:4103 length:261 start_codon:yes stop_codon:yes gene_type:complete
MKIFIYKILTAFVLILILYKLTIGHTLKIIETKIQNFNSKENVEQIKEKVRNEIKDGLNKDRYLTNEDAKLINDFLNKIKKELKTK